MRRRVETEIEERRLRVDGGRVVEPDPLAQQRSQLGVDVSMLTVHVRPPWMPVGRPILEVHDRAMVVAIAPMGGEEGAAIMTTMLGPLRRARRVAAGATAVSCGDVELTYDETWERCRRLVGGLQRARARRRRPRRRGRPELPSLPRAVPGRARAPGMVLVPLNQRHTEAELRYAIEDAGAAVLFAGRDVGRPRREREARDRPRRRSTSGCSPAALRPTCPTTCREDTLAGLFYTGGTTGAAKGVMLTHRNLVANAFHYQAFAPFRPETCWLIVGAAVPRRRLDRRAGHGVARRPARRAAAPSTPPPPSTSIERHGVTDTLVVPTMLAAMSEEQLARPRDVGSLRTISHGGSPIATETLRRAHQAFPDAELQHLYGATETAPIATTMRGEQHLLDAPQARSCGQPAVGVDIEIARRRTAPACPTARSARCVIRGPNVMVGYWNKPEQTAAALVDGWYRSRRPRLHGRRRLPVPRRPGQGHDRHRRRERVLHRGRGRAVPASGRARGGRVRRARRAVGRGGARGRRARAPTVDAGRADPPLPRGDRRLQGAQADRAAHRAAAEVRRRQGAQARAARAVLGRARPRRVGGT